MENEMNDFLKKKMSVDELKIDEPDPELVSAARQKILLRKKEKHKTESAFFTFSRFFTLQIKLYQAVLASIFIAVGVFYFTKDENVNKDNSRVIQYANADSLKSSSVKDNRFLVKNFVTIVN